MWATSSRCGRRRPQAEVGTQTDPPTPPVSPARAPAAPPTHHLTQTEEEPASDGPTHAQREEWADACATATRWADYRRRERLEARWHEQAAERGVVAHTTAPTAHRSAGNLAGGALRPPAPLPQASGERQYCWRVPWTPAEWQLRRRCEGRGYAGGGSGRWAAEGEAQTTAAHRSAQRAVEEAMRREGLRRRGELDEAEAVEHYEYEEYNNTSPRRSRSRSRPRTATWSRPTDEVEEEWSWEVRSHSE